MVTPDTWVKVKLPDTDVCKIVAGWSGGYLDSDYWKVNSGIEREKEYEDYIDYVGYSGSTYRCYREREGVRMSMASILQKMLDVGCTRVKVGDDV